MTQEGELTWLQLHEELGSTRRNLAIRTRSLLGFDSRGRADRESYNYTRNWAQRGGTWLRGPGPFLHYIEVRCLVSPVILIFPLFQTMTRPWLESGLWLPIARTSGDSHYKALTHRNYSYLCLTYKYAGYKWLAVVTVKTRAKDNSFHENSCYWSLRYSNSYYN